MVVIDSFTSKDGDRRVLKNIEAVFAGVQRKSFNAQPKVAAEEIFDVPAAAPRVIATDVMIEGAEHGIAFTSTLYDVHQPKIRIVLDVRESIDAPEIHIPFEVAVPLGTRRERDLLDFFSGFRIGEANVRVVTEPRGHGRFGLARSPPKSHEKTTNTSATGERSAERRQAKASRVREAANA